MNTTKDTQFKNEYQWSSEKRPLPILFILAKTYGAAKAFMRQHELEKKLKYQYADIVYLGRANKLRGIDPKLITIVTLTRWNENKDVDAIMGMICERRLKKMDSFRFLDLIQNSE